MAVDISKPAHLFKTLGDPTRLRLLLLLADSKPLCCIDLSERLGVSAPTVTHHMKRLSAVDLVMRTKKGKWAYYTVNKKKFEHIEHLIRSIA